MANSPQAIKRVRQAEKHRLRNMSQKSTMRTMIKNVLKLIKSHGDAEAVKAALKKAAVNIDRLVSRKLVHKNKAARLKSRLNLKVKNYVLGEKNQ